MNESQNTFPEGGAMPVQNPQPSNSGLAPVGQTLKQSWEIIKEKMNLYLLIEAMLVVVLVIWTLLLPASGQFENPQDIIKFLPLILVMAIIGVISQTMMSIMTLRRGESWTFGSLLQVSLPKFFGLFLVSFLTGLYVMLGFIALVIPGIHLIVALAFASYIYLDQNLSATESISKSREYVKGMWWPVFGRLVAFGVIMVLVSIIFGMFFGQNTKLSGVMNALLNFVIMPFATVYFILIYEQLKKLKQGV